MFDPTSRSGFEDPSHVKAEDLEAALTLYGRGLKSAAEHPAASEKLRTERAEAAFSF